MRVVLATDVAGLGRTGDVKNVADGYARNYLIPRRLATPATEGALKQVAARQATDQRRQAAEERRAMEIAGLIQSTPLVLKVKVGSQGRLYGSITAADVAEALGRRLGEAFDKRRIELEEPIKTLGEHQVRVRIWRNVSARLTLSLESA